MPPPRSVSHPGPELGKQNPTRTTPLSHPPRAADAADFPSPDRSARRRLLLATGLPSEIFFVRFFIFFFFFCASHIRRGVRVLWPTRVAEFPEHSRLASFPGSVTHTSEYRVPSAFTGQRGARHRHGRGVQVGRRAGPDRVRRERHRRGSNRAVDRAKRVRRRETDFVHAASDVSPGVARDAPRAVLGRGAVPLPLDPPGLTDSRDFLTAAALGKIRLRRSVRSVRGDDLVAFEDGASGRFDAIVFATGFGRRASVPPRTSSTGTYRSVQARDEPDRAEARVLPVRPPVRVALPGGRAPGRVARGDVARGTRDAGDARDVRARRCDPRARDAREARRYLQSAVPRAPAPGTVPAEKGDARGGCVKPREGDGSREVCRPGARVGRGKRQKAVPAAARTTRLRATRSSRRRPGGRGRRHGGEGRGEAFRARGWLGGTRWRGVVCV